MISWRLSFKRTLSSATKIFLLVVLFLFSSRIEAMAAFSFSVTEINPATVDSKSQEIQVKISVNSLPSGDSYFRAGISSGSSSLGYLKNNSGDWIKLGTLSADKENGQCANYFKVSADGEYLLSIKIGEDNDISNGEHAIKAYRFTSTCGSYSDSSETPNLTVNITLPTATPTLTMTPTESPPSPTSSPSPSPTQTFSPTPKPTKASSTPSPTPTPAPKPTVVLTTDEKVESLDEGGITPEIKSGATLNPSPQGEVLGAEEKPRKALPLLPKLFIGAGLLFLLAAALPTLKNRWYNQVKEKNGENEGL